MIIVVCGFIHSGTSYVAELLIKHGAIPGKCNPRGTADYHTHENTVFKAFCASVLDIDTDNVDLTADNEAPFVDYLASLDPHKTYLLKYPKSVACLNLLRAMIGPHMRAVFVARPVAEWVDSYTRRTGTSSQDAIKDRVHTLLSLSDYNGQALVVDFRTLISGVGKDQLLEYVGLKQPR